jgi:sigma-B regulation protein RsbU (phosphoserine phosphatase)
MTGANVKKILLVDDNQLFLKMLSQAFKKAGIECITAESAKDALAILKTITPDAILSDYEMPDMNGMEFRQHLMDDVVLNNIPFVFLTYITDNELMVKGLNLEAVDYVTKDTPLNVIVSKLNNLLYTVHKQQELSKQELKKAAEALNVRSIPTKTPNIKGFEIDFWHQPYQNIPGGDFIDFIQVNDRYTFIVLGDIMGKKWMAWFFTFSFLSYVRAAIRFGILNHDYSVASIMQKVNDVICYDDVLKDILSSLSLIMIDNKTQQISYAGAGDLPLLYYESKTSQIKKITADGLLLGLFPDGIYTEQHIKLAKDDQLFIFTDGMIDFLDLKGKKSDYNNFMNDIEPLLNKKYTFKQLKTDLFEATLATRVDDCSIINIYKTT